MAQANRAEMNEIVQSLAYSINENLIKSPESKFVTLLQKYQEEMDARTLEIEQELMANLNEMEKKLKELKAVQKKMGILCISLGIAVVTCIIIQVI